MANDEINDKDTKDLMYKVNGHVYECGKDLQDAIASLGEVKVKDASAALERIKNANVAVDKAKQLKEHFDFFQEIWEKIEWLESTTNDGYFQSVAEDYDCYRDDTIDYVEGEPRNLRDVDAEIFEFILHTASEAFKSVFAAIGKRIDEATEKNEKQK